MTPCARAATPLAGAPGACMHATGAPGAPCTCHVCIRAACTLCTRCTLCSGNSRSSSRRPPSSSPSSSSSGCASRCMPGPPACHKCPPCLCSGRQSAALAAHQACGSGRLEGRALGLGTQGSGSGNAGRWVWERRALGLGRARQSGGVPPPLRHQRQHAVLQFARAHADTRSDSRMSRMALGLILRL